MAPLAIVSHGMMSGLGLSAPATCAALRCGLNRFVETKFIDDEGQWIVGSPAPLGDALRGRERLIHLAAGTVDECLIQVGMTANTSVVLVLCLAEEGRPGGLTGDERLIGELGAKLGITFHSESQVLAQGRTGAVQAMHLAGGWLSRHDIAAVVVVGVDSYLHAASLRHFIARRRIKTASWSNGFIPGEAAAAMLLRRVDDAPHAPLRCLGLGFADEPAPIGSGKACRATGLTSASRAALAQSGLEERALGFRITDLNGEHHAFREASLVKPRILRTTRPRFDTWHIADGVGEVGAATVPLLLGVAAMAQRKRYAPGRTAWIHTSDDAGRRAALIVTVGMES